MFMPDVLALPLLEACAELDAAGVEYTITVSLPPRQRDEDTEGKISTEYVVRQQLLDDNKVALVTVKKYRKEVLEDGIGNQ